MKYELSVLALGVLLVGPASIDAADPSASIPSAPIGRWQGTASEVPGIYSGPVTAKVTLELKPDGTYTETWKQGSQEASNTGTWRVDGRRIVLESSDRSRERVSLQRRDDVLYAVAMEALPNGRATTMAIELHPAP